MAGVRHNRRTRSQVIKNFVRSGRIDLACEAAGVHRSMHYDWLERFPDYKAAYEKAREPVSDMIESEMFRRGVQGVKKPIFHSGKRALDVELNEDGTVKLGTNGKPIAVPAFVIEYSDTILIRLAQAHMPQKYRDNASIEHTGAGGAPLTPAHTEIVQVVMLAMESAPPEHKAVLAAKLLELEPPREPGS